MKERPFGRILRGFTRSICDSNNCICGLIACVPSCPAQTAHQWTPVTRQFLAPYQGSPWAHIDHMLDVAGFKEGDRILDLGAGKFNIRSIC